MEEDKKLFYTIAEVSKMTGVKPYILRYWESEFGRLKPEREKGRRRYRQEDIELVIKIKKLLKEDGFKITGAKSQLREATKEEKNEESEKLKNEIKENEGVIAKLKEEISKIESKESEIEDKKEEIAKLKQQLRDLLKMIRKEG